MFVPADHTFHIQNIMGFFFTAAEYCLPDWFDAKRVATMILLAADVEEIRHTYK